MNFFKIWMIAITFLFVTACGGADNDQVEKLSFEDFVVHVSESTDTDAQNCGIVDIEESDVDTNTCVVSAYLNDQSFHALYRLQGIDSEVGAALTGNTEGRVLIWHFDSSPGGGVSSRPSLIEQNECENPELTGSVDSGHEDIFRCDN